jgi:hypothetical protein
MSDFVSLIVQEVLGPGCVTEDAYPLPKQFRGIPMPVGGVPPATPAGARVLTGSPASTIPQPK